MVRKGTRPNSASVLPVRPWIIGERLVIQFATGAALEKVVVHQMLPSEEKSHGSN